ncbi:MAG: hypothetical protein ACRYGP_22115 [Janthinobacterium lividum]
MLLRFDTPNSANLATWINPEHVAGVHTQAPEVTTVYLVGGFEQRVAGSSDEVARRIDEAQRSLRGPTPAQDPRVL